MRWYMRTVPERPYLGREATEGEEAIGVRIVILTFSIAVGLTGGAGSGAAAPSLPAKADKPAAPESCSYARSGVAYYRGRFVHHQQQRGASVPTWRKPRNCADARYLADVWAKRAELAHQKLVAHRRKMNALTLDDFKVRDGNHAWHRAVREVQGVYPGTESWLLSCSTSEGGHGKFVQNSDGANVWGWLQFAPGTFSGFVRHAIADVRSRGYRVPKSAWALDSVLGQALAGAWGITHGMRHHWAGAGCW